ncbi:TetR/AcrR family transcriptional regulator [Winogradskyella sediminis]|jgi:AcrR family transcriptional regulator|uniref:TetR/AcrR family transcriptional regulator n=1 Tax=Winogradskyella sediminis TaxID=1382466 RepID=UPI000E273AEF|nr:TetR/AcrR family transcriptional regulator [Winogradskyella sediminis]REG87253.1 TetR family transcriptional regulator [Winogradskyella sediminis]
MSNTSKDEFVKTQIIEAAKTVFETYGFRKANMALIAKASGKGRSTLYYYYKNKEDVFKACMLDVYKPLLDICKSKLSNTNTLEANLSIYAKENIIHIENALETYKIILHDLRQGEDFISSITVKIREQDIEMIKDCLTWAIQNKEIEILDNEHIIFLATIIVNTIDNTKKEFFIYETLKGDMLTKINWINNLLIQSLKLK